MSLALEYHAAHKARLARMSGYMPKPAPTPVAAPVIWRNPVLEVVRQRREYETHKSPSQFMPLSHRILHVVAAEFGISVSEMVCKSRDAKFLNPRYVAIGLLLEMTNMSLPAIGRRMGGRDHTTMINARNKVGAMFAEEAFRNRLDQIKAEMLA